MAHTVNKLLAIARSNIGYHEKDSAYNLDDFTAPNDGDSNYTKYSRDLAQAGYYQASKQGYDWCDVFVDWCFWTLCDHDKEAAEKMTCQTGVYGAGVDWSGNYFRYQGRLDTTPQIGDQAFYGDYAHTGIVSRIEGDALWIIEGNTSNEVQERRYSLSESGWKHFGHPFFEEEPEEEKKIMFQTINDMPDYAKETIQKLMDKGFLKGDGQGNLNLSEDMVRIFVIHDRAGLYD